MWGQQTDGAKSGHCRDLKKISNKDSYKILLGWFSDWWLRSPAKSYFVEFQTMKFYHASLLQRGFNGFETDFMPSQSHTWESCTALCCSKRNSGNFTLFLATAVSCLCVRVVSTVPWNTCVFSFLTSFTAMETVSGGHTWHQQGSAAWPSWKTMWHLPWKLFIPAEVYHTENKIVELLMINHPDERSPWWKKHTILRLLFLEPLSSHFYIKDMINLGTTPTLMPFFFLFHS